MKSVFLYTVLLCGLGIPPLVISQYCPEDWDLFDGSCYRYFPGVLTTWDSAQSACTAVGGNLASISTLAQSTYIYDMMLLHNPLPELENYWIGMFKEGPGLSYKWVDGSAVVYTYWAPGEPSDSNGYDNCVRVLVDTEQMWDDADCTISNGAVCETTVVVQACPSDNWDLYGDNCYRYYPDDFTTSENAEQICIGQGAHLASLNTEAEALYLHSQMEASNPLPELKTYWIGLFRQGSGNNFAWIDGSPYGYQRWWPGQPDNDYPSGSQDCVRIYGDNDLRDPTFWDDIQCHFDLYGFICKMPKENWINGKVDTVKKYPSLNHLVEVVGQTSEDSRSSDGLSTGATAGIVLGGLVAFVCVGTIVFMMMYRRKKMAQQAPSVISVDMANNHI